MVADIRSRALARALAAATLAALMCGSPAAARADVGECRGAHERPETTSLTVIRSATLCLVNAERARRGLPALRRDGSLARVAKRHARDMAERGYFSHATPEGKRLEDRVGRTRWARSASRRWRAGEAIAWGERNLSTPAAIVRSWMRSRSHRRLLLARGFDDIGINAVRKAPRCSGATYVAVLGAR